jgi:hypothetical protein
MNMKFKILLIALLFASLAKAQVVVPRSPTSIQAVDARLKVSKNLIMPVYSDTTHANLDLGKDSIGAIIKIYASGDIYTRDTTAGGHKWTKMAVSSFSPSWGSITGTLSSQTDLQNALNQKQNLLTAGTTSQYYDGTLTLRTFPTLLSQFTNDPAFISTVRDSNSITGNGVNIGLRLVNDVTAPGIRKYYGTDTITGVKGWFQLPAAGGGSGGSSFGPIATQYPIQGGLITSTGTISIDTTATNPSAMVTQYDLSQIVTKPDTLRLIPKGAGQIAAYSNGSDSLFFKSHKAGYGELVTTDTDSAIKHAVDTSLIVSKIYFNAHNTGGGGGGGTLPDTIGIKNKGAGVPLAWTNASDSIFFKALNGLYGIITATQVDSSAGVSADTASAAGLVSKARLTATIAALPTPTVIPPNIGTGVPVYATGTPRGFRRFTSSNGTILFDTTTTTNSITANVDTSVVASKTYITNVFSDTTKYNLETVMQNSSLLTHAHLVQGPAITWGNGINSFAAGIKFGTASTTTSGQGQLYVVTASAGHDSLYYNATAGPYNLMRVGGGLDPYIGRHVTSDSIYLVLEHVSGKWDSTAYTGYGSGGGGGGSQTWQQTLSATSGSVLTTTNSIDMTGSGPGSGYSLYWTGQNNSIFDIGMSTNVQGLSTAIKAVTANYTATNNDDEIFVDATSANVTISFPGYSTGPTAKVYHVWKTDATGHTVTLVGVTGSILNGSTLTSQYANKTLVNAPNGNDYYAR